MTTAEALEQVGQKLQAHFGDAPVPGAELTRQAALLCGYQESSVIPSDFCYNRTNSGIECPNQPLFVQEGRGQYRFVGLCYPYKGAMFHKPHGQPERVVGSWHEGDFTPSESD